MASTRPLSSELEAQEPKVQENFNPKESSHEFSDLEAGPVDGKPESKNDINEVNWETDNDSSNPLNWSPSRKWRNLGVISIMSLTTPLASTMFAPAIPQVMAHFHSTSTNIETFIVSIFVLGFAFGPLLVAPLSEIYGRRPVYLASITLFLIFTICCAVSNSLGMLIAFRFLCGCAGSTAITLGGATIGDTFPQDKRGAAMATWGMGPMLGPILGPIIGGYLSAAKGWRWIFWLQAIISGALTLLGLVFLKETYAVVILEKRVALLRKEIGNQELRSALHDGLSPKQRISQAITRPLKMLFLSPIVLLLSIYVTFLFGLTYLFVTTFPRVFMKQYGFSTGSTGLSYLGLGAGMVCGMAIAGKGSDVLYKKMKDRYEGKEEPEYRLPPLVVSAPLVAVSFFWYGWSAQERTHWIVPILGTVCFGLGMFPGFMSINMYLVHTYGRYSASAIAASKVLQSIGGAFLPLAGEPLYDRLGLGWGNSVIAFIALAFSPMPWLFFKYGGTLRKMGKVEF
ncbi:MFS multidrug transporter-like protein [Stipitochalara longipes BDJ]|nr:MFS multidrug transporter-like protein [Stipitochalara longipes BDJ]